MAWVSSYTPSDAQPLGEPIAMPVGDPIERAKAAVESTWKVAEKTRLRLDAAPAAFIDSAAKGYATALKAHRDALTHQRRMEIEAGRLISAERLADLDREFIQPLAEVLRAMDVELGPEANPLDPRRGIAACASWRENKVHPLLRAMAEAVTVEKIAAPAAQGGGAA